MRRAICLTLVAAITLPGAAYGQVPDDRPVGWLFVPDLYLYLPLRIVPLSDRQWDTHVLGQGAGWLDGTNRLADDWGTVAIAAHSPGGFETLNQIRPGALVIVGMDGLVETYAVTAVWHDVPVTEWQWTAPSLDGETVVLITCEGDARLIVEAERIE